MKEKWTYYQYLFIHLFDLYKALNIPQTLGGKYGAEDNSLFSKTSWSNAFP